MSRGAPSACLRGSSIEALGIGSVANVALGFRFRRILQAECLFHISPDSATGEHFQRGLFSLTGPQWGSCSTPWPWVSMSQAFSLFFASLCMPQKSSKEEISLPRRHEWQIFMIRSDHKDLPFLVSITTPVAS